MNTIRRNTWIHMGDRLKYMGTDGNIEAQRKQETMQKAKNRHGKRRPKLFCCRWIGSTPQSMPADTAVWDTSLPSFHPHY